MMPFGEQRDLKLIRLVEQHPVLYNQKYEKRNSVEDTRCRDAAWQIIGEELKMSALACKTRWVNIRDNMRRKIRWREMPDNKRKRRQKGKYKYEDKLTFVLPFLKGNNYDTEQNLVRDEDLDDSLLEQVFIEDEQEQEEDEEEMETKPNLSDFIVMERNDEASFNDSPSISQEKTDSISVFLEAVGSTLRELNPYYLNQAKSRIFQVVQDCELQQIVNKGETPATSQGHV